MNPDAAHTSISELISDEALKLALNDEPVGIGVHAAAFDVV